MRVAVSAAQRMPLSSLPSASKIPTQAAEAGALAETAAVAKPNYDSPDQPELQTASSAAIDESDFDGEQHGIILLPEAQGEGAAQDRPWLNYC